MSSPQSEFDYIIVGGGTAGCVVASRLREALPQVSIALIEAGKDAASDPLVQDPRAAQALHDTDLQWKVGVTPQPHLDGRTYPYWGGKLLSGGSGVNYTAWTRGHAADYDRWAEQVGDARWAFESLLPAFKRSEHWHNAEMNPEAHGFHGPIRTQSGDFGYPLRTPMMEAFESTGHKYNPDMNAGNPNGISPLVVNWHNLKRQHASACYSLKDVHIICDTLVSRLIFDESNKVVGVELQNNEKKLRARREVIVSCGSIRTPQLLLLSGIGPREELEAHKIKVQVDLADVGEHFHDHMAVTMFWKLKEPESGFSLGSPAFNKPSYADSLPMDWFVTGSAPDSELTKAATLDEEPFRMGQRSDYELTPMYLTNGAVPTPWLPFDGHYVSCGIMGLSTTSRGSVKLGSADVRDNPIVNPNNLSTEHDHAIIRVGMRIVISAMSSPALASFLEPNDVPPPGLPSLSKDSSDEEFNKRIRALAMPWYHASGTAAMGKVVDTECRVKGVQGLRVIDASVIPLSLSAHLQAPVYALAEQAVSMIIDAAM